MLGTVIAYIVLAILISLISDLADMLLSRYGGKR